MASLHFQIAVGVLKSYSVCVFISLEDIDKILILSFQCVSQYEVSVHNTLINGVSALEERVYWLHP